MNGSKPIILAAAALSLFGTLHAQESGGDDSLEITMRLLPAGAASPEAITKTIELPASASPTGVENSANGLRRANEAREARGADHDRADEAHDRADEARERANQASEKADEARERGREFGAETAEQARENRDNATRGDRPDRPDPPNHDPPGQQR
jgi:hypothetical protein